MLTNRETFLKALEHVVARLPVVAVISVLLVVSLSFIGGLADGWHSSDPQTSQLGFIVGAFRTLGLAIPITLCVSFSTMVIYGLILFIRFRKSAPKA